MDKKKKKEYEAPCTKRSRVELEDNICASSEVSIGKDPNQGNVEVDDYASIENDVIFE